MDDQIWYNYDQADKEIDALNIGGGGRIAVGIDGVRTIRPVPVAGNGAWIYWIEVTWWSGASALFNPVHLLSINYRESEDE
jgi:hypothetical protein